jgi:hypothetical protein
MKYCLKHLRKAEDPQAYKASAEKGMMLAYPTTIDGQSHRKDNGMGYHATIKTFEPEKDHPHVIHNLAQHLPLGAPDEKNTQIEPGMFKDKKGNDIYVLKLHGRSADKLKENNAKFSHMGKPQPYEYEAHISVPKAVHDQIKAAGHKTAHEAGIKFGPAELKRGHKTLKTYHQEPDSAEPKVPDESDFTARTSITKAEPNVGQKPLMKPFVSDAQRRWGHTAAGEKALGGKAGVHEWDEATKGKKLPERITKSEQEIKSLIKKEHSLHSKFSKALSLTGDTLKKYIEDNKPLKEALKGK